MLHLPCGPLSAACYAVTFAVGAVASSPATSAPQLRSQLEVLHLQPAIGPVPFGAPPSASTTPMTLAAAIHTAMDHATSVERAATNARLTGAQVLQSYAQFLPNLGTTAAYQANWGNAYQTTPKPSVTQSTNQGLALQLQSSINLFNGLADQAGLAASLARQDSANFSVSRAKQQIAIDITQAYLQVILDQRLVEIAKQSLESSRHREELLKEQTKLGVKDVGNLYTQEAQTATDETSVVTSTNRLQSDIMRLLQRLKLSGQVYAFQPPELTETLPFADTVKDEELVQRALNDRQDVKAMAALSQAAQKQITVAEGGYYPHVDASIVLNDLARTLHRQSVGGVDQAPFAQDPWAAQLRRHANYTAQLGVTWSIFDRQVTHLTVARAEADAALTRLDEDDLKLTVLTEVKQAREDIHSASSRLATARRGVLAANKSYERIEARYGIGAATFLDLTTAQVVLAQAQTNEAQAQVDLFLQTQVLLHVVGQTPLPS